jgi:hypothetical protein
MQRRRVWVILVIAFLLTPLALLAQDWRRGDRGDIQVTNDWENTVRVTLWKERGGTNEPPNLDDPSGTICCIS